RVAAAALNQCVDDMGALPLLDVSAREASPSTDAPAQWDNVTAQLSFQHSRGRRLRILGAANLLRDLFCALASAKLKSPAMLRMKRGSSSLAICAQSHRADVRGG